ncbi:hypothetical protein [Pseudomonas sp. p106]|uniref:hypothetical protein n=1 Tax=Pseudomonas sp. p106 TaxID=2479854 RepID=UPI000F791DE0|nr:hypothetical protein [Pseudomonas sp. p106]RRV49565.1 hypothetical protein EGJ09_01115 [Pseudomonas sp. p106]
MSRSTCWSLLAFAMALLSYTAHRDISANIFLGVLFIIQGLKHRDGVHEAHWDRISLLCTLLSAGIIIFALYSSATGMHWARPRPW